MLLGLPWYCSAVPAAPAAMDANELMRMAAQLDQLDKLDFNRFLDKARECTQARDFDCAEQQIGRAGRRAHGNKDQAELAQAKTDLTVMKRQVEEEAIELARRERELERAEQELQEAEARAEREAAQQLANNGSEDQGMSTADGILLFGSLLGQSLRDQAAMREQSERASTQRFNEMQAGVEAGIARDQKRFAAERRRLEAERNSLEQQQLAVAQPRATPAPTPVSVQQVQLARNLPADTASNQQLAGLGARIAGVDMAELNRPAAPTAAPSYEAVAGVRPAATASAQPAAVPLSIKKGVMGFYIGATMSKNGGKGGEDFNLVENAVLTVRFTITPKEGRMPGGGEDLAREAALSNVNAAYEKSLASRYVMCVEGKPRPAGGCFTAHLSITSWQIEVDDSISSLGRSALGGFPSQVAARAALLDYLPDGNKTGLNARPRMESSYFIHSSSITVD